jgi:hypothetical protein
MCDRKPTWEQSVCVCVSSGTNFPKNKCLIFHELMVIFVWLTTPIKNPYFIEKNVLLSAHGQSLSKHHQEGKTPISFIRVLVVEKLVWVSVISFCKPFILSYMFDALLRQNWLFSSPNRLTLRITFYYMRKEKCTSLLNNELMQWNSSSSFVYNNFHVFIYVVFTIMGFWVIVSKGLVASLWAWVLDMSNNLTKQKKP